MKRALVVGTGRVALGVAGELLRDAGMTVTFVGRNAAMVDHLQRVGRYRLQLLCGSTATNREITGVDALHVLDPRMATAIEAADLVVTAVGATNLATVADLLVEPLRRRTRPLDVIAFENHHGAAGTLRSAFAEHGFDATDGRIGLAGALVSRAVTAIEGDPGDSHPLTVIGDPVRDVLVERAGLVGRLPLVDGLHAVDSFHAYAQRKLYVFSAGHATAAYLGQLKGYRFVHAAVRDPEIRAAVLEAMREGQSGVAAEHGAAFAAFVGPPGRAERAAAGNVLDDGDTARYAGPAAAALDAILERFANGALHDPVERVGRDPRRKLATDDRLLGAARMAGDAGIVPRGLMLAAAAALCFDDAGDPSSSVLRHSVDAEGVTSTLVRHCGFGERSGLAQAVSDAWLRLTGGWQPRSELLSLERHLWA